MPKRRANSRPAELQQDLRRAWLLLLVTHEPMHGYALHTDLRGRGLKAEPGAVYRTLRRLEGQGLITSSWADAPKGPPRRVYSITPGGREELEAVVRRLTRTRDAQSAFLREYKRNGADG